MKKILFLMVLSISLISCRDYTSHYEYGYEYRIPDSLKKEKEKFITETVRAASNNMTGGDYEDPEDLVYASSNVFNDIHRVKVEGLNFYKDGQYLNFIEYSHLDSAQKIIFNDLKTIK